ncbi:hypothetical protein [Tunturiibacter gelidoferens]|uniref:Uncharacterized protein n=1 Tax=Tunturiibacter gelidiferens TaxID=3069689 RepID=A0ACC5NZX5_9BACT|nr:hypothetical protein [Edaphobacter lichenicola]MBB5340133.1 hypothetical protein [Edaphobacter lichenicola]
MNCVNVEAAVLGLVKGWCKAGIKQSEFEEIDNFVGGAATEHRNANGLKVFPRRKLASQAFAFGQQFVYGQAGEINSVRMRHGPRIQDSMWLSGESWLSWGT